jgi:hypothetical protein
VVFTFIDCKLAHLLKQRNSFCYVEAIAPNRGATRRSRKKHGMQKKAKDSGQF